MRSLKTNMYFNPNTGFLMICKEGLGENTIKDILKSVDNIEGEVEVRFNNIIFLTIYPKSDKVKKFDSAKNTLILRLTTVTSYLSVLFDSQTVTYMQEISKIVYRLEREFRALIEIVFLKHKSVTWYKTYFSDSKKEKDRTEKRPETIQYIDNPLDKRNFVDLTKFVSEKVSSSKDTILQKLEEVQLVFEDYLQDGNEKEDALVSVLGILKEIQDSSNLRSQGVLISDLYEHLTPTLSIEWENLYQQRNLWAHNYCLFTQEEFLNFRRLSNTVLRKIRTEITLISLLNDVEGQSFIVGDRAINISLYKIKSNGTSICKLKIKINLDGEKDYLYEISRATYADLIHISILLADFAQDENSKNILKNFSDNPFLTNIIKNTIKNLIESQEINEKINGSFNTLKDLIQKEFISVVKEQGIFIKEGDIDKQESKMNDDLNHLLQSVFKTT
jgi:hypothetical protein